MSDEEVRRLPAALDAPLARIRDSREELAKLWLVRLLERASLDEIEQLPTARIARELPALVGEIVDAIAREPAAAGAEAARDRAARLAQLRAAESLSPAELTHDVSALQAVLIGALRSELQHAEPPLFGEAIERLATIFAAMQAGVVEELTGARERELELLANTDHLTALFNVRWLRGELERLVEGQRRYGRPFSLLVMDIDGLKRINDSRGHATGDRALITVAGATREAIRAVDAAARIGGDEFCILAPEQEPEQAALMAERVSSSVTAAAMAAGLPMGVSIGVVSCPQHGEDADGLLELADEAMYRAKADGAAVAVAGPAGAPPTRSARS